MDALLIATITHAWDDNNRSLWTVTLSYPRSGFAVLTLNTGNPDEAQDAPHSLGEYLGYTADQIDVHHNY